MSNLLSGNSAHDIRSCHLLVYWSEPAPPILYDTISIAFAVGPSPGNPSELSNCTLSLRLVILLESYIRRMINSVIVIITYAYVSHLRLFILYFPVSLRLIMYIYLHVSVCLYCFT